MKEIAIEFISNLHIDFEKVITQNNMSEEQFAEFMYNVLNNINSDAKFALLKVTNRATK